MRRAQLLAQGLSALGLDHELLDTSVNSVEQVGNQLKASRAIVIIGGDGLVHHSIQRIVGTTIPIGIIPAGSGNDFWRMTMDSNAEESLAKVLEFFQTPPLQLPSTYLSCASTRLSGAHRYALGAVSWGFEATVNAKANALPRQLGALRALQAWSCACRNYAATAARCGPTGWNSVEASWPPAWQISNPSVEGSGFSRTRTSPMVSQNWRWCADLESCGSCRIWRRSSRAHRTRGKSAPS